MWFAILFQISALVIVLELLVGSFAEHFDLQNAFWSYFIIYGQATYYGIEIVLFSIYLISISIDYGIVSTIF